MSDPIPKGGHAFPGKLIGLIVLVNVFAMALAALALHHSYQQYQQRAAITSQNLAQVLERQLAVTIDGIDDALLDISEDYAALVRQGDVPPAILTSVLQRRLVRADDILGVGIVNARGGVESLAGTFTPPDEIAEGDYFRVLRDKADAGLVVSSPIPGGAEGPWVVVFARRLGDADGRFAGMVFAAVALDRFSGTFARLDLGPHGAVALRDATLAVIARHPITYGGGSVAIGQKAVSSQLTEAVASNPQAGSYYAQAGIDGVRRTLSYRRIGNHPLYVVVGLAPADYLTGWRRELWLNLGLLALFMPLTWAAAAWLQHGWQGRELALRQSRVATNRFRAILAGTPIGLAIVDGDRKITQGNDALAIMFGMEPGQMVGLSTSQLYPSDADFAHMGRHAYGVINSGGVFTDVQPMRRRDGSIFWSRLIGRLVDLNEPDQGYVWICEDVSEQRRADEALRLSEERFRLLVEGVRDYAILRLDKAGCIDTWNAGAQAINGYQVDEIVGKHFSVFYTPEDIAAGMPQFALETAAANGRFQGEGWRVRKDGSRFWAAVTISALHGSDGAILGYAKITRDISERQKAEAQIHRLVAYQHAILTNTPVGIAIIGLDRTISHANEAFCRIFGRDGEALGGHSTAILYESSQQFDDVGAVAYQVIRAGGTYTDDVSMRRKDGSRIWVRLIGHLVDASQPDLGVVWAAEDISALKELNESLLRSNADLERFAYVTSHDLRQPLRMISSYIGLIERRMGTALDGEIKEFMGYVTDGAQRMDRMIVDLLDYSRIARLSDPFQPVSLADMVARARANLANVAEDAGAEIVVSDDLPTITGSASELERLFQNLIGNAIKFRAPDRPPRIQIGCHADGRQWIVSVTDNGIGIDPTQFDRLFAIFSRLVPQTKYDGTGIGLAACRKIAEHHGGRIWVESAPDRGSTFFVALADKPA